MEWVYAVVELPWDQGRELVVLPRRVAAQQAHWVDVFWCATWGEVRREATPEEYEELLERAGFGSFEGFAAHMYTGRPLPGIEGVMAEAFENRAGRPLPADEDEFIPIKQIPAHADGDFPPADAYLMYELLPNEITSEFGNTYETSINGTYVRFDPEVAPAMVEAMRKLGMKVVEDVDLVKAAVRPLE